MRLVSRATSVRMTSSVGNSARAQQSFGDRHHPRPQEPADPTDGLAFVVAEKVLKLIEVSSQWVWHHHALPSQAAADRNRPGVPFSMVFGLRAARSIHRVAVGRVAGRPLTDMRREGPAVERRTGCGSLYDVAGGRSGQVGVRPECTVAPRRGRRGPGQGLTASPGNDDSKHPACRSLE